jgi:hypothetical protein
MVGILVHGDNHFIARGPLPNRENALALTHAALAEQGDDFVVIEFCAD